MNLAWLSSRVLGAVVVGACLYLILPTLVIVPISFTSADYISFPPVGFSLRWYEVFIGEGVWRSATLNSLLVALLSATCATVTGTAAALGLRRLSGKAVQLVIALILMPMIVPGIIIAVALYGSFSRMGIVGTHVGLVVAHTILALPFVVINVSAVMQKVDWRTVDAARSLGAGPLTAFRKVTLPSILPGAVSGAVFAFLTSFDEVVVSIFLTGIDTVTLPVQMWNGIRFEISPAVASASSIMLGLSVIFLALYSASKKLGASRAAPVVASR